MEEVKPYIVRHHGYNYDMQMHIGIILDRLNGVTKLYSYISMFRIEPVEPVELVEPCIICYDSEDEHGNMPVASSDFLQTNLCNCEYMVHASCMRHWLAARPINLPSHQIRCLVCSSIVEKKRSVGDRLRECCRLSPAAKRELCRYAFYLGGVALFGTIAFGK